MSRENLDKFRADLVKDEQLRAALKDSVRSEEELVAAAAARGYDFTVEELRSGLELDEEQLEAVAGGVGGHEKWIELGSVGGIRHEKWIDLLSVSLPRKR